MANVTEQASAVGDMLLQTLQNTLGLGPEEALAQAQAATGVTSAQIDSADMGQVFDYMCDQPDLSPQLQGFLTNQAENYNNYGNVSQAGSSYSGGGGGGYGGSYGGGGSANAQIVQQVTQNYNYQEINDNHIDILGPVNGDIDIDQDNDDVDVTGDGNAVNTGDGDQNAATGDGSSAAQSDSGNAVSNSGDGSVVAGDDVDLDNSPVGDGNIVLDNEDGTIEDSSIGFGDGNVQGDVYNEEGAANSQGGDATGQSVDTNVNSDVNEEHGDGDLNDGDGGGYSTDPILVREPLSDIGDDGDSGYGSDSGHDDYHAPEVNVNVEGGDGDQHVDAPDDDIDPS